MNCYQKTAWKFPLGLLFVAVNLVAVTKLLGSV